MQPQRQGRRELLLATRRLAGVVALVALSAAASSGDEFSGRVVGVSDGDTISVMRDGRAEKVRLEGIDCPEGGQPFGQRAKQATSELVFGRDVRVEVRGKDRYGRVLGRVFLDGLDLNLELVRLGLAWHFTRYSSETALAEAHQDAKAGRRGLWADVAAVPPWEWRQERGRRPAS